MMIKACTTGCLLLFLGAIAVACGSTTPGAEGSGGSGTAGTEQAAGGDSSAGRIGHGGGSNAHAGASSGSDAGAIGCESDADCAVSASTLSPPGCAVAKCSATEKACVLIASDSDGDGFTTDTCSVVNGAVKLGDDCDDSDAQVYPGAWDGPQNGKSPDRCDQVDNDCSGKPDDGKVAGKTCECDPVKDVDVACSLLPSGDEIKWPTGSPVGDCKYGKRSCVAGTWGECKGAVAPTRDDACTLGSDANCDGKVNNNANPEICLCVQGMTKTCAQVYDAKGVCGAATVTCDATGRFPACPVQSKPEVCDATKLDENCDGEVNEHCACLNGESKTCGQVMASKGDCAARPLTCQNGQWSGQCAPASAEICGDKYDENCDGQVNELPCICTNGETKKCGDCGTGVSTCVNGAPSVCVGDTVKQNYHPDFDGDGYCNTSSTVQLCAQQSGYLPSSCANDCKDTNAGATTACTKTAYGASWGKPWGNGCEVHTWSSICPAGFSPSGCSAVKDSGGGTVAQWGTGDNYCSIRICDNFFESASAYPVVTCVAK